MTFHVSNYTPLCHDFISTVFVLGREINLKT